MVYIATDHGAVIGIKIVGGNALGWTENEHVNHLEEVLGFHDSLISLLEEINESFQHGAGVFHNRIQNNAPGSFELSYHRKVPWST